MRGVWSCRFSSVFFPLFPFFRCGHDDLSIGCLPSLFAFDWGYPLRSYPWTSTVPFITTSIQGSSLYWFSFPVLRKPPVRRTATCADKQISSFSLSFPVACFPFFHNRFSPKQSSFSPAKIVCRRERLSCLDQWRNCLNLPLSSLAILPAVKNKAY